MAISLDVDSQQKSTMAVFLTDVCHGKHIAII